MDVDSGWKDLLVVQIAVHSFVLRESENIIRESIGMDERLVQKSKLPGDYTHYLCC